MDRKYFLKSCGVFGIGSCFLPGMIDALAASTPEGPPVTSCEEKQEFAQKWVKRFFDTFDESLDQPKRKEIMERCGKACFQGSIQGRTITPADIDIFIGEINKYAGEVAAERDGNVVDFHYVGNPRGLKVTDGYCLCPLVESGPAGLSGTFCDCSVGYVKEMFKTYTGRSVTVDLLESLKRGDKGCRFRITLSS